MDKSVHSPQTLAAKLVSERLRQLASMCYYHTNLPANRICSRCGRGICLSCTRPYGDLTLCTTCFRALVMANPRQLTAPATTSTSNTQTGSPAKPHTPHRRTIIVLLTISALLIWTNADAILWWPGFYGAWVGIFPWIVSPEFSFILGVMLGLVIDMGVVLYSFGFRVEAAFIVLPTAIISLFIGGGFLAGLIIAVLTGIFIMMNEEKISQLTEPQIAIR